MLSGLLRTFYFFLYWHVYRPGFKLAVRLATGKCELQRIMECVKFADGRTSQIEFSLINSKHPVLKHSLMWRVDQKKEAIGNFSSSVLRIKKIEDNEKFQFSQILLSSLTQIHSYQEVLSQVENKRQTPYSSDNSQHEEMLQKLWTTLCPNEPLQKRISKQWSDIGFQGDDPKTDFRGMGLLGLMNLLYFGENYTDECRQALSNSQHPEFGYSFAIVGINITALVHSLLEKGQLKRLFYIRVDGPSKFDHFNEIYCTIFQQFNSYWMARKPNIMQFSEIRRQFKEDLLQQLNDNPTVAIWKLRTDL